jgi:acetate kinase
VNLLVVNVGSSSLKMCVLDSGDRSIAATTVQYPHLEAIGDAVLTFAASCPPFEAVGHRVVHGGLRFQGPIILDDVSDGALQAMADLAPLHNPPAIAAIVALRSILPSLVQIACFDTSFHAGLPAKAATYALPRTWREQWGARRFGFHGLSHAWSARRAAELLGPRANDLRLVTAHLGSGASLAAVFNGRSVDTTMGFTPLEGLVMATRSGTVDPGIILWAQRHGGLSADQVEHALEHESGILGLSGLSGDLRRVLEAADSGVPEARLAYEVYVYRIQTSVAAMCAAVRGLDGLVFTGGAGEASSRLRRDVCDGLDFLGVRLDDHSNNTVDGDAVVSSDVSASMVVVVQSREELEIARQVRGLLG